jgi:D-glycero-alpha-D-manno-heptose 1-phosphate guanylyltransferase
MIDTAIILAGGFGTRLKHVVNDVPKPMAPINDIPFLSILLKQLAQKGLKQVVLATGYKHEVIESYFGDNFEGLSIYYSIENSPLGTGGAIAKALHFIVAKNLSTQNNILILNGDSYFDLDFIDFQKLHKQKNADISIALKHMENFDRYGVVETNELGEIQQFKEKQPTQKGLINTGSYIINTSTKEILDTFKPPFSFEQEILENSTLSLKLYGFSQSGYFIDIGIPQDYQLAQTYFGS